AGACAGLGECRSERCVFKQRAAERTTVTPVVESAIPELIEVEVDLGLTVRQKSDIRIAVRLTESHFGGVTPRIAEMQAQLELRIFWHVQSPLDMRLVGCYHCEKLIGEPPRGRAFSCLHLAPRVRVASQRGAIHEQLD